MVMMDQLSVKELMKAYDFRFSHECHCDGYHTEVYRMKNHELRYRLYKKPMFRLTIDRKLIKNWSPILLLQNYLKELFPHVAI